MYLICIVRKGQKDVPVLCRIQKYNEAVPRLNAMLRTGEMTGCFLPEERPREALGHSGFFRYSMNSAVEIFLQAREKSLNQRWKA